MSSLLSSLFTMFSVSVLFIVSNDVFHLQLFFLFLFLVVFPQHFHSPQSVHFSISFSMSGLIFLSPPSLPFPLFIFLCSQEIFHLCHSSPFRNLLIVHLFLSLARLFTSSLIPGCAIHFTSLIRAKNMTVLMHRVVQTQPIYFSCLTGQSRKQKTKSS